MGLLAEYYLLFLPAPAQYTPIKDNQQTTILDLTFVENKISQYMSEINHEFSIIKLCCTKTNNAFQLSNASHAYTYKTTQLIKYIANLQEMNETIANRHFQVCFMVAD